MLTLRYLHKYFATDQERVPFLEKLLTYVIFGFIIMLYQALNLLYVFLPRRFYLNRVARTLEINAFDIWRRYDAPDDMPPLQGFVRRTHEWELAGYQHECDLYGYKSALSSYSSLYNLAAYSRFKYCFHREIMSIPRDVVQVRLDNGAAESVINTCSYNYLGLSSQNFDLNSLVSVINQYGLGCYINRAVYDLKIFRDLEKRLASFLGTEDCIIHSMGYDTNAMSIPCICDEGWLILSDKFNHNSIARGCVYSHCVIKQFNHNDLGTLERLLRENSGHFSSILVIVEGLYSMEGTYIDLPYIIELKKKHSFYLFVDEAHSIGAVGPHGGGVRDYYNLDHKDIDFYMGTFTKSFSSSGGYVAGKKCYIDKIRQRSYFYNQQLGYCPAFAYQILNCLDFIQSETGLYYITKLRENSIYFRKQLYYCGFKVLGNIDSPVIPLMFYNPTKMKFIYEELLRRKIAIVVVGFPAVPLLLARIRFCMSALHSREQLDYIISHMDQLGDFLDIKFDKGERKKIKTAG